MGWGIAWYINGLMIPEIHVVRGKTYTFVIEGGNDPDQTAAYHPFYITDDPEGGYEFKTKEQRRKVRVFAGIQESRGIQLQQKEIKWSVLSNLCARCAWHFCTPRILA